MSKHAGQTAGVGGHKLYMASKEGISFERVVGDCDHAFKQFLDLNDVVQGLVEKKVIRKKIGDWVIENNARDFLIGKLKKLSPEKFGKYLEVVQSIEENNPKDKGRPMMRTLSTALSELKLEKGSPFEQTVSEFTAAATRPRGKARVASTSEDKSRTIQYTQVVSEYCQHEMSTQSVAAASECIATTEKSTSQIECSSKEEASRLLPATLQRPPAGSLPGGKSACFTKAGGMLYSPEHGVTVMVSERAVPPNIDTFVLGFYPYMCGQFTVPKDVEACSPVVWLFLSPYFEFQADVVVKIPHAVLVNESDNDSNLHDELCVLTVSEVEERQIQSGSQFSLTRCLKADFSDGHHAVFTVRHFSPHVVGKKKRSVTSNTRKRNESGGVRKRTHSNDSPANRRRSKGQTTKDSVKQSSQQDCDSDGCSQKDADDGDQSEPGMRFCIARCMPINPQGQSFTVDFMITYCHPTGMSVSSIRLYMHRSTVYDCSFFRL